MGFLGFFVFGFWGPLSGVFEMVGPLHCISLLVFGGGRIGGFDPQGGCWAFVALGPELLALNCQGGGIFGRFLGEFWGAQTFEFSRRGHQLDAKLCAFCRNGCGGLCRQ